MTNYLIKKLYETLVSVAGDLLLPIVNGYAIIKNKKILEPYYAKIEECRLDIIKQYANINGDEYEVPPENMNNFTKDIVDLLRADNEEILIIKTLFPDNLLVSLETVEALMPMISEED